MVRVFAAIATLLLCGWVVADEVSQPMIGEQAPEFELKAVDGSTLGLDGLRGKYLVIHFGASW